MHKAPVSHPQSEADRKRVKEILQRAKRDRVWGLRHLVRIKDETGKEVPFNLFAHQEEIIRLKHDPTVRTIVIGKYRKAGVSVVLMADHVLDARFNKNKQIMILNKDDVDTAAMFDHVHFIDKHLPDELQGPKSQSASKELKYADSNSLIRIGTAGSSVGTSSKKGRGVDTACLHGTEFRFYNFLAEIIQGATNSIPEGGKLIFESTSNGPRGAGPALINNIRSNGKEERKGELWRLGDQVFLFISAIRHPKCRRPVPIGFELEDEEERRIFIVGQDKGLPVDEIESFICFRRWKIQGFISGGSGSLSPEQQFKREFPVTFEDGEEAAGSNYFNHGIIQAEKAYIESLKPYKIERSIIRQPGAYPILSPPTNDNRVTITAAPEMGYKNRYVVFADCGQGHANSDPDCIKVFDRLKNEVCATAHGRMGAIRGVQIFLALAELYDNAWISWDMTGIGAEWRPLVLEARYPKIYTSREVDNPLIEPESIGIVWNQSNKLMACSMLRSLIETKQYRDFDTEFFEECLQFGFDEKGAGPEAAEGFTDDRVSCAAGMVWTSANLPPVSEADVRPKPFQDQNKLERRVREIREAAAQPVVSGGGNWD